MQTDTLDAAFAAPPDGDFTNATANYALCDRKYDVIAMTSAFGNIQERIAYTPYGEASQRLHEDINNDGVVNGGDIGFITNNWGATIGSQGYNPDADLNDDGTINGADISPITNNYNATGALPGQVSAFGNTIGYSGYVYDDAINLSLARFRWYDAELGTWGTRDPSAYVDSLNLYQYTLTSPLRFTDPYGLEPRKQWDDDEQRRAALCKAIENSNNLHDFVRTYNPTWGEQGRLLFNLTYDSPWGNVDVDWLLTILHAYYYGARHYGDSYWFDWRAIFIGMDPGLIYAIGKTKWIIEDGLTDPNVGGIRPSRYGQDNEKLAASLAREIIAGRKTLKDIFPDLDCNFTNGDGPSDGSECDNKERIDDNDSRPRRPRRGRPWP